MLDLTLIESGRIWGVLQWVLQICGLVEVEL